MTTPPFDSNSAPRTTDEVDSIVSAWKRELPTVDTTPMHVLSRMSRLTRLLDLKRKEAFGNHALETWEFDVLAALRRAGEPYALTPGTLMNETLVSSGTMTNRIDRLEAAGLVKRTPSPDDRRAVLVTLTPAGRERVDEAVRSLVEFEEGILTPLNDHERTQLTDLLRRLLLPFDQRP